MFRPTTVLLAFGLLAGTLTHAMGQEGPSQPELKSGFAQQARIPQLPAPTGHFGVGRVAYQWTDESRRDPHAADSKAHRDLMVYLWYPAPKRTAGKRGEYLPGAKQMNATAAVVPAMREEFEGNWPIIVSGTITSLAVENAPVARSQEKFPVVVLVHGAGGTSFEYTALVGDLVSHGYVVAAIESTYAAVAVAFPDGRIVPAFHEPEVANLSPDQRFQRMMKSAGQQIDIGARDIVFVLDQLTKLDHEKGNAFALRNTLDLNRVASMGHSAGGAAATLACEIDARFKACLSLDGQMPPVAAFPEGANGKWFTQPVLLLEVDHNGRWMGFNAAQNDVYLKKKEDQLTRCPAGSYDVVLKSPGLVHGSFSDYPFLTAAGRSTETRDAVRNLSLTTSYILAFLNQTFNRVNSPLLEIGSDHPDSTVKRYGH